MPEGLVLFPGVVREPVAYYLKIKNLVFLVEVKYFEVICMYFNAQSLKKQIHNPLHHLLEG